MKRSSHSERFFTVDEQLQIESAIQKAEQATSAEIKLIVLRHCWQNIQAKAIEMFKKHQLHKTRQRNAVLILLVTTNREFLIFGDEGIHQKVGQSFWDDIRDVMSNHFHNNEFGKGLQTGIGCISEKLQHFYPCGNDDINEIDNEVAYED